MRNAFEEEPEKKSPGAAVANNTHYDRPPVLLTLARVTARVGTKLGYFHIRACVWYVSARKGKGWKKQSARRQQQKLRQITVCRGSETEKWCGEGAAT
jgi:hypothetical protein